MELIRKSSLTVRVRISLEHVCVVLDIISDIAVRDNWFLTAKPDRWYVG